MPSDKIPKGKDIKMSAAEREKALERRRQVTDLKNNLKQGQLPTNEQITTRLQKITTNEDFHKVREKMSSNGQSAMTSLDHVLLTMKRIVEEKNAKGQLQKAVFHATKASNRLSEAAQKKGKEAAEASTSGAADEPTTAEIFKKSGSKILHIARLLVTSSQFRKLINDLNNFALDTIRTKMPRNERLGVQPGERSAGSEDAEATRGGIEYLLETTTRSSIRPIASATKDIVAPHFDKYESGEASMTDAITGSAKEISGNLKQVFTSLEFNDEQRERLTERFRNIVLEAHENKSYREALEDLLQLLSLLKQRTLKARDKITDLPKTQTEDTPDSENDAKIAKENLIDLLQNFAGGRPVEPMANVLNELINNMRNDKELEQYTKDLYEFVSRSLRDADYVRETKYISTGSELIKRARQVLVEKHKPQVERLSDEISGFNKALQEDPLSSTIAHDFEQLGRDMFLDEHGKASFKPELAKDFVLILPLLTRELKYIPLPRIEGSNKKADYNFDNIVLGITHIAPDYVRLRTDSRYHRSDKAEAGASFENRLRLTISHVQAAANDVDFYVKYKEFPRLTERGLADVSVAGKGITIDLEVQPVSEKDHALKLVKCKVKIDKLKLKIHGSKRDLLYKIFNPLINSTVKGQAQKGIRQAIEQGIRRTDQKIIDMNRKNAEKAKLNKEKRAKAKEEAERKKEEEKQEQKKEEEKPKDTTEKTEVEKSETEKAAPKVDASAGTGPKVPVNPADLPVETVREE
ncbi:uncharacterized protein VTP21DRAFT_6714 [Calcarisporiella thermophila]|uniref:uncharacterized protein n=1 Tax=Calcarisporiella thermophila TaxID=911321 RepID=UPI003742CCD8